MARQRGARSGCASPSRGTAALAAFALLASATLGACSVAAGSSAAPCAASAITVTAGQFAVGLGHFGGALLFRNDSRSTCTLRGYPSAVAVGSMGTSRTRARDTARGYVGGLLPGVDRPPLVTLAPGAIASALLEGTSSPRGRCRTSSALLVELPGARTPSALGLELAGCARVEVHPVVAGSTGDQRR